MGRPDLGFPFGWVCLAAGAVPVLDDDDDDQSTTTLDRYHSHY